MQSLSEIVKRIQEKGFTLIEIISAIAILFIGIISIFSLFPASYRMADLSKISTQMTFVAQSKMDELVAMGFNNIPAGTFTFEGNEFKNILPDEHLRYRYRKSILTVTDKETNPLNDKPVLKEIVLTLSYEMRTGKEKTETFTSYISNNLHG